MGKAGQEDEQGLREANRDERGVHLGSDVASDSEALGPCLRVFRQFLIPDVSDGLLAGDSEFV